MHFLTRKTKMDFLFKKTMIISPVLLFALLSNGENQTILTANETIKLKKDHDHSFANANSATLAGLAALTDSKKVLNPASLQVRVGNTVYLHHTITGGGNFRDEAFSVLKRLLTSAQPIISNTADLKEILKATEKLSLAEMDALDFKMLSDGRLGIIRTINAIEGSVLTPQSTQILEESIEKFVTALYGNPGIKVLKTGSEQKVFKLVSGGQFANSSALTYEEVKPLALNSTKLTKAKPGTFIKISLKDALARFGNLAKTHRVSFTAGGLVALGGFYLLVTDDDGKTLMSLPAKTFDPVNPTKESGVQIRQPPLFTIQEKATIQQLSAQ